MLNGFVTAVRTLTCLPIPGREAKCFSRSLPWFAVVGIFLGVLHYLLVEILRLFSDHLWIEGSSIFLLLTGVIVTRGLHLDGLSDWADALGGAYDREKRLTIMKDSFLGTFGVSALVLILLSKWASYTYLIKNDQIDWIIPSYLISRVMQVDLAVWFPYAREQGTASQLVAGATIWDWLINLILACSYLFIFFGWQGVGSLLAGWIVVRLLALWSLRRIGGVTGDILGAGSELAEIAVLSFPILIAPLFF